MFEKLFEPLPVGSFRLPNRIVMPAMGTNLATPRGEATQRLIQHYRARAEGGAGLVIVEGTTVHPTGKGFFYQLGIDRDDLIPSLTRLASEIHETGALTLIQLHHGGRNTDSDISGRQPWAPSPVRSPVGRETPREMTRDDIEEIILAFTEGACRARDAGFDGVELHGAHEYLISQFLSPYSNFRTDSFGGSLENRLRFAREIIQSIRSRLGEEFLLSFRISGDEYVPRGLHLRDSLEIAQHLVAWGINIINVSGGVYETPHLIIPPLPIKEGVHLHLAQAMKQVLKIPVIGVGRINQPQFAEKVLQEGRVDLVAIGRAFLADPDWPRKARSGSLSHIRRCVGCNQGCIDFIMANRPIACLYNPTVGKDKDFSLKPTERSGRVVVVGAGPAGLEAATALSGMGHQVYLLERSAELGGQLKLAGMAPGKAEFKEIIRYYDYNLRKSDIRVYMNTEADLPEIKALDPDWVVLATGSNPVDPEGLGVESSGARLVSIFDALTRPHILGDCILICGGGNAGCEVADFLSSLGKQITIMEMGNRIARDLGPARRYLLIRRLREQGVKNLMRCRLKTLSNDQVTYLREEKDGHRSLWSLTGFDNYVNALGVKSSDRLGRLLRAEGIRVHLIGDALSPGKILDAVAEGAQAARAIDQKLKRPNKKT